MRVLAVDTATPRASVALVEKGEVRGEVRFVSDSHSPRLLPAVAFLLETLGLRPDAVEGYAVTTGPGSFTGLRVGLSTVQGLALGGGRPVLGVPTLDALAGRAVGEGTAIVAMLDAFRSEVFAREYDAAATPLGELRAEGPAALLERIAKGSVLVGDGALRYRDLIASARPDAVVSRRSLFLAATLGRVAEPRLDAGEGRAPGELRALYVRPPDIRGPRP